MPAASPSRAALSEFIVARRESLGLRQVDLADRTGLGRAYINSLERGKLGLPGVEQRRALADALRVRHVDLLVVAGELSPQELAAPVYRDFVRHPDLMRQVEDLDDQTADVLLRFLAVFNAPKPMADPEFEPDVDAVDSVGDANRHAADALADGLRAPLPRRPAGIDLDDV